MASYFFGKITTSKINVRTDAVLSSLADDEIALGVGDENDIMDYGQVTQIHTAVLKLLNSARDRQYPSTGVGVRHYLVQLGGTKPQIVNSPVLTAVDGTVSFAMGVDFGFAGHGPITGIGYYSSVLVDAQAKIITNFMLDNFFNTNQ